MSDALRVGSDGVVHLLIVEGYTPKDLSSYAITGTAKFVGSSTPSFNVTISEDDWVNGQGSANFSGADLTESGTLALELTFTGSPTIGPNAAPILIPVRDQYAEAA